MKTLESCNTGHWCPCAFFILHALNKFPTFSIFKINIIASSFYDTECQVFGVWFMHHTKSTNRGQTGACFCRCRGNKESNVVPLVVVLKWEWEWLTTESWKKQGHSVSFRWDNTRLAVGLMKACSWRELWRLKCSFESLQTLDMV